MASRVQEGTTEDREIHARYLAICKAMRDEGLTMALKQFQNIFADWEAYLISTDKMLKELAGGEDAMKITYDQLSPPVPRQRIPHDGW